MSIPTVFDWLEQFAFLRGYPAAWGLLCTGVLVALFLDWRLSLLALIVQYLLASLLFFDLLNPQLAMIKLFTGMFVCLILYWTASQLRYHNLRASAGATSKIQMGRLSLSRNLAERLAAVIVSLLLVVVLVLGFSFYLPGLPDTLPYINLAVLILVALGMAGLIASRDPLPAGMAILTFLTGFELYFAALDQTTRTLALFSALNFLVALSVSYLTQRRYSSASAALYDD